MVIQVSTVGRLVTDVEQRNGSNGSPYTKFDFAVQKGYGESRHTVFFQVTAFNEVAKRLEAAKAKKGSLLMISGDMDVKEFTRKNGTKGTANEIVLHSWDYVGGKSDEKPQTKKESSQQEPQYDEYDCDEDDDLPY